MPIYIETERLILRDHTLDDLPTHAGLLRDGESMYYLPEIQAQTLDDARENLLESMAEIDAPDRKRVFLRIETKFGKHVGEIGYTVTGVSPFGKRVELGYFTRRDCWGNGFVPEAARALLDYAFTHDDVNRVCCGCCADNTRSERVMQKIGLIREGYLPEYTFLRGALRDRVIYRMLRSEWEGRGQLGVRS